MNGKKEDRRPSAEESGNDQLTDEELEGAIALVRTWPKKADFMKQLPKRRQEAKERLRSNIKKLGL